MPRQAKNVRAGTISVALQPAPPKGRRELKRDVIIEAAKELFFAQGYERTSMNDIVERVGGSKATLYSHFPSKDELLLAIVKDLTQPVIAEALSLDASHDFPSFLRALGLVTVHGLYSPEMIAMQRIAAAEAIRFPEFGRIFYEEGIAPGHRQGAAMFQAAMDKGVLRRTDPVVALETFIELCLGWRWRKQIWNIAPAPSQAEIDASVDAAVEVFMRGYGKR